MTKNRRGGEEVRSRPKDALDAEVERKLLFPLALRPRHSPTGKHARQHERQEASGAGTGTGTGTGTRTAIVAREERKEIMKDNGTGTTNKN